MLLVICDIDGTIADIRARLRKAGNEPDRLDKKAFQEWLDKVQDFASLSADKPIVGMFRVLTALSEHATIVYLTGRSEKYRAVTAAWLDKHSFPGGELYMRKDNDWRSPARYKKQSMRNILKGHTSVKEIVALDDDGAEDCADLYKEMGITHLRVIANG